MDDTGKASRLEFGSVTFIPDERLVLKDGLPVPFTPKAFDLLAVLAANPGHLLTKEHLMQAVWPDTTVEESNLTYHVFAIRKALGESAEFGQFIETVPKRGYRFVAPVRRVEGLRPATSSVVTSAVAASDPPAIARPRAAAARWLGLAGAFVLGALLFLGRGGMRTPASPPAPLRFQEPVLGRLAETGMFSVSPDGRRLVYAAEGTDGVLRLWVRTLSTLRPLPLPGTEVFTIIPPVVWSPDSRFIAYDPGWVLKKVSLDGGAPQSVCETLTAVGGGWNEEGVLLLGNALGGLVQCAASGGAATPVTTAAAGEERHIFPSFLSDGRRFLYLRISRTNPEASGIYLSELGAKSADNGRRLITTGFSAAFVPATEAGPGAIVFARDGALFAQRFDERRLALIGEPMRLADRIGSYLDGAFFSVSPKTLVYRAPEPESRLTWFDRGGREIGRVDTPGRFFALAMSPHGDRALVSTNSPQGTADEDLWLFDLTPSAIPRRITFGPELERGPVWVDDDQFVFGSGGGSSGVYQQTLAGARQLLFKSRGPEIPTSMSAGRGILLYTTITGAATRGDVWVRSGTGAAAAARPFVADKRDQSQAQLSPDRRWVAYVSNEAGPDDVFLTQFRLDSATGAATHGESIRISQGGARAPRWSRAGRELLYLAHDGSVMSIEIDSTGEFRPSAAKRLFNVQSAIPEWGVTRDGARFLFAVPVAPPPPFEIVQDWQATLPK